MGTFSILITASIIWLLIDYIEINVYIAKSLTRYLTTQLVSVSQEF